jgi:REP element-mobilizing transposase RayT
MGRALRIDIEDGWYHVMNRGVAHQRTFFCDADRVEYGRLLGVGHERFGVEVHAYCLLPNHYHLLLHCPDAGLSEFMQVIASVFTRHVNERAGRDGPLFRGRFHSIPVVTTRQLLMTARYIHRNALDVEGVTDVATYRWSSHRTYLGHRACPPWLRTNEVLSHFDDDPRAFDRFVSVDRASTDMTTPVADADQALVDSLIDLVLDEQSDRLSTARQGVARTVLLLLTDRLGECRTSASICEALGFPNSTAEAAACRRARRRAAAEPGLVAVVDRVIDLIR